MLERTDTAGPAKTLAKTLRALGWLCCLKLKKVGVRSLSLLKSGSLRKEIPRIEDLSVGFTRKTCIAEVDCRPTRPRRVLAARGVGMHKAAGPAPSKNHLFIELEELRAEAWTETGRWNHALEEDALPLSPGH